MEELEYEDINIAGDDPNEFYYLYDFLYIGDSFIARLQKSGIIHESCSVLAKSGTAARDWYVSEDNDRFVDYYDRMIDMDPKAYKGIVINYGINDIKNATNLEYSTTLIDDLQKHFPGVPVFVLKIMPVAPQFELRSKSGKLLADCESINRGGKYNVETFNKAMESYARRNNNVWFVDASADFLDSSGNLDPKYADERGLHIANEYVTDWCKDIFAAVSGV